ncbi:hypothetical protein EYF80_005304 [Liparis tanakae]|uniref:Uncharacterized protein n=1 Tax=Liparis tanakae TaxID=230148 RepID=A0A4Z2J302_9TELE|nr:hypothetical protein EYF80_005304 [Liparis tanakae]
MRERRNKRGEKKKQWEWVSRSGMAARCSLAVSDSFSTSICCLQSEFWLLTVSSLVCRASSSDSFFDNSCFNCKPFAFSI